MTPLTPLVAPLRSAGITLAGCDRRNGRTRIDRMTMIDQWDGEEKVWGTFFGTMNHIGIQI